MPDFILESNEGGAVRGRYSLIGLAPDLVFQAWGKGRRDRRWGYTTPPPSRRPVYSLKALRALVTECRADVISARAAARVGLPRGLFRL